MGGSDWCYRNTSWSEAPLKEIIAVLSVNKQTSPHHIPIRTSGRRRETTWRDDQCCTLIGAIASVCTVFVSAIVGVWPNDRSGDNGLRSLHALAFCSLCRFTLCPGGVAEAPSNMGKWPGTTFHLSGTIFYLSSINSSGDKKSWLR